MSYERCEHCIRLRPNLLSKSPRSLAGRNALLTGSRERVARIDHWIRSVTERLDRPRLVCEGPSLGRRDSLEMADSLLDT